MIPKFLQPERVPYASVEIVRATPPASASVHRAPASGCHPSKPNGGDSDSRSSGTEVLEDAARSSGAITQWWVRLRFLESGHEETYVEKSAINRGLLIIATQLYADVVAQGER